MTTTTLLVFPPSLDCEFARFLLTHYEIPYTEERHTLIFSPLFTLRQAGTILFPVLIDGSLRLDRVRPMVDALDPRARAERRLLREGAERIQLEADWTRFNVTLGFATATYCYYHLLKHRDIMIGPLSEGTPELEQRSVELAYPLYANTLRLLLWLSSTRAQQSLDTVRTIADEIDRRLADQRPYLVGKRFSLSDMACAVSLAPLVLAAGYGGPLPTLAEMPAPLRATIDEMRQRPSGQFALRIYAEHRLGARRDATSVEAEHPGAP